MKSAWAHAWPVWQGEGRAPHSQGARSHAPRPCQGQQRRFSRKRARPRPLPSQPAPTPIPPGMRWRCQCGDNGGGASLTCTSAGGGMRDMIHRGVGRSLARMVLACAPKSRSPTRSRLAVRLGSVRSGGGADGHGVDSSYVFVVPGARNCVADDMWSLAARLEFGGWRERWWPSQVHTVTHAPPPPRPCPRSSSNPHRHAHLTPHPRPHRHARHAVEVKMQDGRLTVRGRWRWCGGCACESAT